MRVTFPKWPVWNYHFPERDVRVISAVNYRNAANEDCTLDGSKYRLTNSRSGVSGIVFLEKHDLPALAELPDAVQVEYEA